MYEIRVQADDMDKKWKEKKLSLRKTTKLPSTKNLFKNKDISIYQ